MSFLDEILNSDDEEEEEIEEEDEDLGGEDTEDEEEDEDLDEEEDSEDLEEEPLTESHDNATTKLDNTFQIIEDVKVEEEDDTTSDIIDKVLDKIEEGNSDRTKNGTSQGTQSVGTHGNGYSHNNVGHTPTNNAIGSQPGYIQPHESPNNMVQNNAMQPQYGNANGSNSRVNYGNATYPQEPQNHYNQNNGYVQGSNGNMPTTYLWQSIVVTLLCCLPFGIVGIVYASKVSDLYAFGRYAEALNASNKAKTWTIVSLCVGVGFGLLYILLLIVGALAAD